MLQVDPATQPVSSDTYVVKPDVQGEVLSGNGGRTIRLHIPSFLEFILPSQSNFTYEILMSGRGNPIPSRSAGAHSLWQNIRVFDGTQSHLLEEVLDYSCYTSQLFLATKSQTNDDQRGFFEGVQHTKSVTENLYWKEDGFFDTDITTPAVPKPVQICAPFHTHLLDSKDFLPIHALAGLRCEFVLNDFKRALEYTTGSLGVEADHALPCDLNLPLKMTDFPTNGAVAAIPQLEIVDAGNGYAAGQYYRITTAASVSGAVGVIYIDEVNTGATTIKNCHIWSTGTTDTSNTKCFRPGDEITLPAGTGTGGAAAKVKVKDNVNPCGTMRKSNPLVEFEFRIRGSLAGQPAGAFGAGTVRDPARVVPSVLSSYQTPFPTTISPFSIGDRLYINDIAGSNEKPLGVITGIINEGGFYTVKLCPNVDVSSDDGSQDHPVLTTGYSIANTTSPNLGLKVYVKNSDRLAGWVASAGLGGGFPEAVAAAATKVGYKLKNFQFQAKRVFMPPAIADQQRAMAQSEQGMLIEIPTLFTTQVNVQNVNGPTSQLVSIPNITKALGVMSVPLAQELQYDLRFCAFDGVPDGAEEYQYQIGSDGVQPARAVELSKYSLADPLHSVQHLQEYIKNWHAFGYSPTNISGLGTCFALSRAFARRGHYYNLMESGDLQLKVRYGPAAALNKLFVHFLSHIRSVFVNRQGIQIAN